MILRVKFVGAIVAGGNRLSPTEPAGVICKSVASNSLPTAHNSALPSLGGNVATLLQNQF